jgi:hypothetical protein
VRDHDGRRPSARSLNARALAATTVEVMVRPSGPPDMAVELGRVRSPSGPMERIRLHSGRRSDKRWRVLNMTFNFRGWEGVGRAAPQLGTARRCLLVTITVALASLLSSPARGTPHVLPFTYPYATLGEGESEVEAITDVNMLRVYADPAGDPTKGKLFEPQYMLTTEYEYGITDHVELGLYQAFSSTVLDGGQNTLGFDGLKWRARTRLAEAGQWPVDVSLYFELETMHDELSFEEKVNLEKDFGPLQWMANLWVEEPIERPWDTPATGQKLTFVINPTTGFSYQITPSLHLGAEYWARGMLVPVGTGQARDGNAVHHFAGPAMNVNFGRVWFAVALYHQLGSFQTPEPGTVYGQFWGRAMFGLEL